MKRAALTPVKTPAAGVTAPGAPTIGTATASAGQASVGFTPPGSTGGAALTVFTATGALTGASASSASSPIVVPMPLSGFVEAFSVVATNAEGLTSAPSALSNTVSQGVVAPTLATAVTLTGPTTVTVGVESSAYTVALSPVGGTVASPVTVTPTPVAGVTFTPTSVQLTTASPSATFTANASTAGTKAIAVTSTGGLTAPAAISLVVSSGVNPGVPTVLSAIGFNNRLEAHIMAPTSGDTPTSYEWTASNGQTGTVASNGLPYQAFTISGQTNGTPSTFTVKGVIGTTKSAASNTSVAATPVASRQLAVGGDYVINDWKHTLNTMGISVRFYIAPQDLTTLGAEFGNKYVTGQIETDGTGTLTAECVIRYNGNTKQLLDTANSNATSASAAAGGIATFPEQALGFTIPKNTVFSCKSKQTTTGQIMAFQWFAADGQTRARYGTALTEQATDTDDSTIPVLTSTPTAGAFVCGPLCLFSTIDGASVVKMIDSNAVGRGDTGDTTFSQGHLGRALRAAKVNHATMGVSGDIISGTAGKGWINSHTFRVAFAQRRATHVMMEPAINNTTAGDSSATTQANRLTLMSYFPGMPIAVCTLPPLADATGQTPNATYFSVLLDYNTATLAGVAGASAIFDVNLMSCNNGDRTRWAANYTYDGTHFAQAGAIPVGAAIAAQMSMFIAPENRGA